MQCQSLVKECLLTHSLPSGFFPKSFKRWLGNLARPCARPLHLPLRVNLLSQLKGRIMHPNPENLHLHTWLLSGRESDRKVFLSEQPTTSLRLSDSLQRLSTMQSGQFSLIGVLDGKLILSKSL